VKARNARSKYNKGPIKINQAERPNGLGRKLAPKPSFSRKQKLHSLRKIKRKTPSGDSIAGPSQLSSFFCAEIKTATRNQAAFPDSSRAHMWRGITNGNQNQMPGLQLRSVLTGQSQAVVQIVELQAPLPKVPCIFLIGKGKPVAWSTIVVASGIDTVSVGNPHPHVARLHLLYTAASVIVRFDASTGIEKPLLTTSELFASDKSKTSSSLTSLFSSSR
jgi:hypothetical protein